MELDARPVSLEIPQKADSGVLDSSDVKPADCDTNVVAPTMSMNDTPQEPALQANSPPADSGISAEPTISVEASAEAPTTTTVIPPAEKVAAPQTTAPAAERKQEPPATTTTTNADAAAGAGADLLQLPDWQSMIPTEEWWQKNSRLIMGALVAIYALLRFPKLASLLIFGAVALAMYDPEKLQEIMRNLGLYPDENNENQQEMPDGHLHQYQNELEQRYGNNAGDTNDRGNRNSSYNNNTHSNAGYNDIAPPPNLQEGEGGRDLSAFRKEGSSGQMRQRQGFNSQDSGGSFHEDDFGKGGKGKGKGGGKGKGKGGKKGGKDTFGDGKGGAREEDYRHNAVRQDVEQDLRQLCESHPFLTPNDFDFRCRRFLGELRLRDSERNSQDCPEALTMIYDYTKEKKRDSVRNMAAYLYTLLRKFDPDLYEDIRQRDSRRRDEQRGSGSGPRGSF